MIRATLTAALAALSFVALATLALAQSPGPLQGKIYGSGNKALVVVLHGDLSSGGQATYHFDIANSIARANPNVTVMAMIRPGYSGGSGLKSPGSNTNRSDHYTKRNNQLVAQTIQNMAQQLGTTKVIGVGHSGGAAQLGGVLGLAPGLLDSAVLVSCPCDIATWRASKGRGPWKNSAGQSPDKQISKIAKGTRLVLIVGTRDDNTRLSLSESYAASAKARGLNVQLIPVNGAGHGFNKLQGTVLKSVNSELRR
ncbi:MAG: alpha/beta hydrolase [Aestuariivita sp.]|uniref:alpha/beta hydrolase family protein n=1 Tax=Aestuariivita sp. TaxID=1872407 RepID=UPI003BAFC3F6